MTGFQSQPSKIALIVGATGMAGQAFSLYLRQHNYQTVGISRKGSEITADFSSKPEVIQSIINKVRPTLIVNCAAIVSISDCNDHPREATNVNSLLPMYLADAAEKSSSRLIHISTDHFYTGDGDRPHDEGHPVTLVNKYAETKYKGELYASRYNNCLIVRTNITGFRGDPVRPTYAEWLIDALIHKKPLTLFTDFYTSTIDVRSLCRLSMHARLDSFSGILNIASAVPVSKMRFAFYMARSLGIDLDWCKYGSVTSLALDRAESAGLDCSKAERLTGESMPLPLKVTKMLAEERTLS